MLSDLHRRGGDEGASIDDASAPSSSNRRAWGRILGGTTTVAQSGPTEPSSRISMDGVQAGVDLFASDAWSAGVHGGKLRSDARIDGLHGLHSSATHAGNLRADTVYLGSYAAYANLQGQYADFVLQHRRQDLTANATDGTRASGDGHSVTASAETSQCFALGGG
ncbi:MAG: hypothetical protein JWQ73_2618 [Variovorax sp.]|jgi:fibronectin-binding autotransporter adhesin|nr:hypothetical protein [Variovorax sp.]